MHAIQIRFNSKTKDVLIKTYCLLGHTHTHRHTQKYDPAINTLIYIFPYDLLSAVQLTVRRIFYKWNEEHL